MTEFPTRFDFQSQESELYEKWRASGGFSPDVASKAEARSILMPPPNANGSLHLGHAFEVALQDVLTRYWRMRGYKTLWQPGADHAGFETQIVYERKLEKEGRTRFGMDRDQLYQEIYDFTRTNEQVMRSQLERLGASCDWSRFRFMLEPALVATVTQTFKSLYDDGLIYRAKRPIHWCTKHQTALSDLEVDDVAREDTLYYLTYGPVTVATVRPETQFGDVAIAVHPEDARYKAYIGQSVEVVMAHKTVKLPVIADDYVDPAFGTGALKITPAHDPNDFAIAERHGLPVIEVIDQYGKLTEATGAFAGLKINEAREKVVATLEAKGVLQKAVPYTHTVKVCFKCKNVIEPRVADQWWLSLTKPSQKHGKSLRDMAVAAVQSGETRFLSERFENQFYSWMNNLRDWPLSRQIVWGIRIPAWYGPNGEIIVTDGPAPDAPGYTQDADVFDTWFSSCQWPFSTLGNNGNDLEVFYPTTIMMPAYEILFFWVARMLMLSCYTQGHVPYKVIGLHGIVRDSKGQKMSKSKGNGIDPLTVADLYGADAVRAALLFGVATGTDPSVSEDKIKGMRNFTTKIWNITRFVAMNSEPTTKSEFIAVTNADHALKKQLEHTVTVVTENLESFNIHLALDAVYHATWHHFADNYIEAAKGQLEDEATKATTQGNLRYGLETLLALLHPFVPFVTEGAWQQLNGDASCLMTSSWPGGATYAPTTHH